jgi:transposase
MAGIVPVEGWGALKARALKGRPMKISAAQLKWLCATVTGKSPLQFRFEFALWTREMIRMLLREEFSLRLSVNSVGRLLRQLGLSCQRPLFRATEQDPERVRCWRDEEFPAIRALAKKAGAVILFGDEAGVRSDYHAGTTWGVKGNRSRPVRDFLASQEGNLRLFFLPPYSPELNPDEQVWNYVKHHGVGKAVLRKFVLARLRSLQRLPWTVRMFFPTPDTQYAAS